MKDLVRMRTSLKEEIERILNEQIKMEAHSSAIYLSMAAWCDRNGFDFSAGYFYKQSNEERNHMLKLFNYVSDMGGHAISPEVTNVPQEFDGFRDVFELALQQEIAVSNAINRIVGQARQLNDFATDQFMQWFVKEQIEEEYVARRAVELFDVIGEEGVGRYMIDKAIPKITYGDVEAQ
ncbi:ferritin [Larkinella punicea]|uniref:Ferritin n=1 Tax=Larkinella punicea TaxID=2315727 RepID=A0A368JEE3_9BACT|nr:ferritin [Larkinella punicea]RCR66050.1 ferritin [Larkinella punicea]